MAISQGIPVSSVRSILKRGHLMIVIDGMGGLVGWTMVRGHRVAVYSADRAKIDLEEREGLTYREAEELLDAAEAGLDEAVDAGDIDAAPVIIRSANESDIEAMVERDG